MSWENLKDAYRTRLGNLTAKSVLVLIVDEASAEGLAFVGLERVASLTEINRRTTLRIIQVFGEIDLVGRTEAWLKGRMKPAFQVNLAKLGMDLREPFSEAYGKAQCKRPGGKCLSDTDRSVAETRRSVAETRRGVAETLPPDPLKGRSPVLPFLSPSPLAPLQGAVDPQVLIDRAVDQVCSALGIANLGRRRRRMLANVVRLEEEKGEPPATTALAMIAAWQRKAELGHLLRPCGMDKFFGDGIWRDERRWFWDKDAIRDQQRRREAGTGGQG